MRKVAGLMGVVLVLVVLALLAVYWSQRSLLAVGVQQLEWEQLRWRDGNLHVAELSAVYVNDQGSARARLANVTLRPAWRDGPRIELLLIDELQLVWQSADNRPHSETDQPAWQLPSPADFSAPLDWLPQRLEINQLQIQLPCEDPFCTLQGGFQLSSQQQSWVLNTQLELPAPSQTATGWVQLQEQAGRYSLQASVRVPESLQLTGVGNLSGSIELDLSHQGDQWMLRKGQADGRLVQPQLNVLSAVPEAWRPSALTLRVTPQPGRLVDLQNDLLLAVKVAMEGMIAGQLQGDITLSNQSQWQVELSAARLQLSAERLSMPAVQLQGVQLDWPLQGMINAQRLELALSDQASFKVNRVALVDEEAVLTGVQGQLSNTQLLLPLEMPEQMNLTSQLQLDIQRLQQASLKPQSWSLQGGFQQSASGLHFDGNLTAQSGLGTHLQLDWPVDQSWQLQVALTEIFLRAANPLMMTFSDWPALLSFSSGRVTGQLQANGRDSLQQLAGQILLTGGDGIYDRASFNSLSIPLQVSLQRDQLRLSTDALGLHSLDPGLPLGPLHARGSYTAALEQLADGVIELGGFTLGVLEGQVQLEPTSIHLAQPRQSLVAVLEGVELARLFEVYPAEGLSGRGTLDGRFPVSLVNGKLLIENGQIQARQPGGVLRYQAQQLQDMAAANPNLEQLTVVLDDFHYRVLTSDVSYDEQGKLLLGLRLEGSNPAFQQGRQVNLSIQLEEDIPALLTSLQLSGQVNEIIRKRIEQHYLQRRSP